MAELTSNTLSGLTTALTIDQGGTGASTVAGIRSGLGLGVLRSTVLTANTTWTVPNGVTQVLIEAYGAGAGGGGGGSGSNTASGDSVTAYGGNGGAGSPGMYVGVYKTVTPNDTLTIVIGKGGNGGAAASGKNASGSAGGLGGETRVTNSTTTLVQTGSPGIAGAAGRGYSYAYVFDPAQYNTFRHQPSYGGGQWIPPVGSAGGRGGRGGTDSGMTAGSAGANGKIIIWY